MYDEYKKFVKDDLFFRPYGVHGVGHTRRVLKLALMLADEKNVSDGQKTLLAIAACYHDIGRINDCCDDEHGKRSVDKFIARNFNQRHGLSNDELELLFDLIMLHAVDDDFWTDKENMLLYQILKDADALDRIRFGLDDLDPKYLRLEESKKLIDFAKELYSLGV